MIVEISECKRPISGKYSELRAALNKAEGKALKITCPQPEDRRKIYLALHSFYRRYGKILRVRLGKGELDCEMRLWLENMGG